MPYFHKRTAKSAECLLDEPVPLRYYSTLPSGTVPRFHPRTMRELMILKSKEFIRDKDKKIISGDPEKVKKIYDTWVFSRDTMSPNPNWQLVDTLT